MMAAWRKFRALSAADRQLLAGAALLLLVCRIGLWLLPYARLRSALDGPSAPRRQPTRDFPARVSWAIGALARRLPGMTCLVQSLAAHAWLRRRGYRPELHIGVRRRDGAAAVPLYAHAWVECDGRVVAGEVDDLAEYGRLQPVRPPASGAPGSV